MLAIRYNSFKTIGILAIAFFIIRASSPVFAQSKVPADAKCYLIVGAFNLERNAALFTNILEQKGQKAHYRKNTYRNMFYVYTAESKDREEIKNKLFKFREEFPALHDSWLYAGNFKGPHIPSDQWILGGEEETAPPVKTETAEATPDNPTISIDEDIEEETIKSKDEELPEEISATKDEVVTESETVKTEEAVAAPPLKEGTYRVYINAYDATSLKEVSGAFELYDAERLKKLQDLNCHEALVVEKAPNATNRVLIKSDVFDFQPIEHTFSLDNPLEGGEGFVEVTGDTILLNFPMKRHEKGDIMVMWKVYFYKDAAIMKEESVGQLNQLLRMMQSNPDMRIMIHGHTNGNSHGKVLHLTEGDLNFFNIHATEHTEINASAKKLSEYRAYTIQHWLEDQGIPEERIGIKGWGGKKMIYDKHDTQAHKNVRVEIEVLE